MRRLLPRLLVSALLAGVASAAAQEPDHDLLTLTSGERLVGELTALVPSQFVEVQRSGPDSRFIAVKDPGDLDRQRAIIDTVTRSPRSIRDLTADELG